MQSSSPFPSVQMPASQATPLRPTVEINPHHALWNFAETCLTETAEALYEAQAANATELSHGIAIARESHDMEKPLDLLEVIARIQGHTEEHIGRAILDLSNKVAATLSLYQPLVPFAGKLITPYAFYESFNRLADIAKILLSPVIYAEDTDAIGTASVNPVASSILAEEIRNAVFKRFGIRPFVTAARLDYENWTFLCRKHFEL